MLSQAGLSGRWRCILPVRWGPHRGPEAVHFRSSPAADLECTNLIHVQGRRGGRYTRDTLHACVVYMLKTSSSSSVWVKTGTTGYPSPDSNSSQLWSHDLYFVYVIFFGFFVCFLFAAILSRWHMWLRSSCRQVKYSSGISSGVHHGSSDSWL